MRFATAAALLLLSAATLSAAGFDLQKVAEGVYVAVHQEPPSQMFDANVVFLINQDDVIVVDTNITLTSARASLAALRRLTSKPVRYVINTHWHEDHIIGNQVWREAYPGVEFIGQETTIDDLPTVGASNRKQLIQGAPEIVAYLKTQLDKVPAETRESFLDDIAQVEEYLAEAPQFKIILPTMTVKERLTLHRGERVIDIRYLGRAHTRADLVVYLPKENIVISGDLVVLPVPLVGTTSYPVDYATTLENLLALNARTLIPGHGPVQTDDKYVRLMARMLASLRDQTKAAVARGETLEQARKSVNLDEFRTAIAGDSALKRMIFNQYVAGPGVAAAYNQLAPPRPAGS